MMLRSRSQRRTGGCMSSKSRAEGDCPCVRKRKYRSGISTREIVLPFTFTRCSKRRVMSGNCCEYSPSVLVWLY